MKKLVLILPLLLCGCQTSPVYLENAKGHRVQCGPYYTLDENNTAAAMHESQCIQDYKEQGYKRVPE